MKNLHIKLVYGSLFGGLSGGFIGSFKNKTADYSLNGLLIGATWPLSVPLIGDIYVNHLYIKYK